MTALALGLYLATSVSATATVLVFLFLAIAAIGAMLTRDPDSNGVNLHQQGLLLTGFFLLSYFASTVVSTDFVRSFNAAVMLFPGLLLLFVYASLATPTTRRQFTTRSCSAVIVIAALLGLFVAGRRLLARPWKWLRFRDKNGDRH